MERLTKYITIIYSTLIILTILGYIFGALYNYEIKTNIPEAQYDSQRNQLVREVPQDTASFYLKQGIGMLSFFGFPIFIIFMSALYLYKEKEGYFKSLLIPISFVVIAGIISFVWLFNFASGEEGMLILYIVPMLLIMLIVSLIVNGIILAIIRKK